MVVFISVADFNVNQFFTTLIFVLDLYAAFERGAKECGSGFTKHLCSIFIVGLPYRNIAQSNDTQHNDIQHYGIQHNDIQHNDIQHNIIQHNDI